jgi:D-alanine-D-alanine ligase
MVRFAPVIHGAPEDRPDDAETVSNANTIAAALEALGYSAEIIQVGADPAAFEDLAARNPAIVFNLVESIGGDPRMGHVACAMMDHYRIPYTGAGMTAYLQSASKILTKTLLQAANLPAPDWGRRSAPNGKKVIIKSVWEHASFGMDQNSVVDGADAAAEIKAREKKFGGEFFAEDYIHGREFNISILQSEDGPHVLPIAEMRFDGMPGDALPIVDYAAKWDVTSESYTLIRRRFGLEAEDPVLAQRLKDISLKCWAAIELCGYGRVDCRMDSAGGIYVLEINANPCLALDAGFVAALEKAGLSFTDGISSIVNAGRHRRGR